MSQLHGLQPSRPKPQWWGAQASQRWPKNVKLSIAVLSRLKLMSALQLSQLSMACLQRRDDSDTPQFSGHTRCSGCQWGHNCKGRTPRHCGCSSSLAHTRCTGDRPRSPGTSTSRPPDGSSLLSNLARDTGMVDILIHPWRFRSSPRCTRHTSSLLYVQCTSGTLQCCDRNCLVC